MTSQGSRFMTRTIFAALLLLALPSVAAAQVPQRLTEQGRLFDAETGMPVEGTETIRFSIYSEASGGTALWTETQSVTFDAGYFSTQLGESTPFAATLFDGSVRYLGVTVGTDVELSPRSAMSSVPYALIAGVPSSVSTTTSETPTE